MFALFYSPGSLKPWVHAHVFGRVFQNSIASNRSRKNNGNVTFYKKRNIHNKGASRTGFYSSNLKLFRALNFA